MLRVSFNELKEEIKRVLVKKGFTNDRAEECAQLFAESSLDGVYSHGLNLVPRFVEYIDKGWINIHARPARVDRLGAVERYDGHFGPGNLNAKFCMQRAVEIARENVIGMVTIKNTNHWGRGGNYGWQAANEGCIGICWTNTEALMPPWGAKEPKIGNNPLVLGIPRENGHIVLDMAMSQFSYGKLGMARLNREALPIDGGFDSNGNLTKDPKAIEESRRILPTGYWKGSGLAILLDLIAAITSGGLSTYEVDNIQPEPGVGCYGISQVFIAIDPINMSGNNFIEKTVNDTINYLHQTTSADGNDGVFYPGERTIERRKENMQKGIPCDEGIWAKLLEM